MSSPNPAANTKKREWAPYWLILPSVIYLALFFAWPMVRALSLAVWDDEGLLTLQTDADLDAPAAGTLPQGTSLMVLAQQGNLVPEDELVEDNLLTELWFELDTVDAEGNPVQGWSPESRIRVREEADDGTPLAGTVRPRLGSNADVPTPLYAAADEQSEVIAELIAREAATILNTQTLELWFQVSGENENGETIEGWAPSRYIQLFEDEELGRIDRGNTGEFTLKFIEKMVGDRFFWPSVRTTILLMVLIIPVQFVLAIIMALVVQARLRGNSLFLYVFAIPLGVSDLAVGILWFAIFTQNGLLNTILQTFGVIDSPQTYLSADSRQWIIVAVFLAEVWRATSIVMIIVVSGLQAISQEVLEAAEIFGATLWQRIRYVILPLLRPSLQVALILRTILALQVFAVVIALSGGDVVTVLANETFRQYDEFRNPNVAAAYAAFILLLSLGSAIFYLRAIRTEEEANA